MIEFALVTLAIWRLCLLPHDEIALPVVKHFAKSSAYPPYGLESDWLLGRMILCAACLSFWLGIAATLMFGGAWYYPLSYSAGVIFLERVTK